MIGFNFKSLFFNRKGLTYIKKPLKAQPSHNEKTIRKINKIKIIIIIKITAILIMLLIAKAIKVIKNCHLLNSQLM